MLKRPHYIAVGLVVLTTLIILNLPGHMAARLKLAIGGLFLPLRGVAGSGRESVDKAGDALVSRADLLKERDDLRRANEQLNFQLMQAGDAVREDARLRQYVGWQQRVPWKLKLARVVLHDPANWWRTAEIDVGSRDGIRVDMPVLTPAGLVGRVSSVGLTRSQIVLLGDPACKVAARVDNGVPGKTDADTGVIMASGPFDGSLVTLGYLSRNANLKPGQIVFTSGVGGIFPGGILIGRVVDTHPVEYGLYLEARVKLAADLGALEEVAVMLP
jgi:rod shape-determining protein MreC